MKYLIYLSSFLLCGTILGQARQDARQYINQYKSIAINEMERSGIPASIILGQAIIASECGANKLARFGNNHLAIKCHSEWEGNTLFQWAGELTPSCFKVYDAPHESFMEHTDKLSNSDEWNDLFYNGLNYKRWAKGLVRLGYSSDKDYGKKLIRVIEQYNLHMLDGQLYHNLGVTHADEEEIEEASDEIYYPNGIRAIRARADESPLVLASRLDIPLSKLLKNNDLTINDQFLPEQYVFLKPKKSTFMGERTVHKVAETENMYLISQEYGIKLKTLLKRNLLKKGEEPRVGQLIYLKTIAPKKPLLRMKRQLQPSTALAKAKQEEKPQVELITKPTTVYEKPIRYADPIANQPVVSQPSKEKFELQPLSVQPDSLKTNDKKILYEYPSHTTTPYASVPEAQKPKKKPVFENVAPPKKYIPKQKRKTLPKNTSDDIDDVAFAAKPLKNELPEPGRVEDNLPPTKLEPGPPTRKKENVHIVSKGETLYRIAKIYETTVEKLIQLNQLSSNTIEIGQEIKYR